MLNKFWIYIGSLTFFIASIKTFLTKEIIGKAGYMYLGKYAYVISFLLLTVSIFLFYVAKNSKSS